MSGKGALLVAVAASLIGAGSAHAAEPGKIAFQRGSSGSGTDIWTVSPVATDETQLTFFGDARHATWSPDGMRLAFVHAGGIYTIREDGTDVQHVIDWPEGIDRIAWSPDGGRMAASMRTCDGDECRFDIYTMALDGSGLTDITPDPLDERNPSWSPDGTRVAFDSTRFGATDIFIVNDDGTGLQAFTNGTHIVGSPAWEPTGNRIAFTRIDSPGCSRLYAMDLDGTDLQNLTPDSCESATPAYSPDGGQIAFRGARVLDSSGNLRYGIYRIAATGGGAAPLAASGRESEPAWQNSTEPPVRGLYARPKGATPLVFYFVPAFSECTAPNRVHGPALASPSCSPPEQQTSRATIGTPDANGKPARGLASGRIVVAPGDPGTASDEADVLIQVGAVDVYRSGDLTDYTGGLEVRLSVRITDRDNTPAAGGDGGATMYVHTFSLPAACAPTADATRGAQCEVDTTLESLVPGAVKEGARAVWELDRIAIYDGGVDDDPATLPASNKLFMVQGLFVP